jgi:5-methylcytosine-specific restriction endonuclease McrA
MTANDWQEWRKNKLQQQEVAKWTSRFQSATGNQEEWQKVFRAYLQSAVWREKRRQVLIRANSKCERCGSIILDPDVHHITYDHVGDERLDELIVLCFPCHRIADAGRDNDTEERRIDAYYEARLNGFAARKYGNGWKFEYEREDVEIKFIMYLYKLYCEEYDLDFDPHLNPETDIDFIDFWNNVRNGYG